MSGTKNVAGNKQTLQAAIVLPDTLSGLAAMIRKDWKKVYFGAVPYLDAMATLNTVKDNYLEDSGKSIVRYFLGNATSWRGKTAKAVKAKLDYMLKES